jgi:Viral BACON domain/Papain family cysteine protease
LNFQLIENSPILNLNLILKKMKKSIFPFFAVALIISVFVSCTKENDASLKNRQDSPKYSLGCQFLPTAEYKALPLATPNYELKTLPALINLATPPIGNQGSEGSCVAWGTTYAGRSIDWYMTQGNTSYSYSTNIFSPEYVYNQIKISSDCGSGAYVTSGLNLLKSQGVCTWVSMPSQSGCSIMPNSTQQAEAANYKIINYGTANIDVNTFKTYLASNQAIVVAGPVNTAFEYLVNGQVLGAFSGSSLGGHCYCVVGYDDSMGAFKFQNSWGTGWASQGYGWISYTYITSWWQEAYVISSNNPPPPPPQEILTIKPTSRTVTGNAGSTSFDITANCDWATNSDASWCTVTASGTGNGQMIATFTANPGTTKRTATITISSSTITIIAKVVQRRQ